MKNAAQRAAKRLRRELRKGPVVATPGYVPPAWKFHRFYLRTREKADEMVQGFTARGRNAEAVKRSGELPWQVMLRANEAEILDPGLYVDKYQDFAEMFGGEYGGML